MKECMIIIDTYTSPIAGIFFPTCGTSTLYERMIEVANIADFDLIKLKDYVRHDLGGFLYDEDNPDAPNDVRNGIYTTNIKVIDTFCRKADHVVYINPALI